MASLSPRLALRIVTAADHFDHATDLANNFTKVDNFPGVFVCTAATRPVWAGAHTGMLILETDTELLWRWNGTVFVRQHGRGYLGGTVRSTDLSTTTQDPTFTTVVSASVTIPAGNRSILLVAEVPKLLNPAGVARVGIFRGDTQLLAYNVFCDPDATPDRGGPSAHACTVDLAVAAGTYSYAVKFCSLPAPYGDTTTLSAVADNKIAIRVIEL